MLGYSKAAVSRQIAKLEQSIGVRLLDRTTRSVTLTPAGREMYARCARIVEEVNDANQVMTGMLSAARRAQGQRSGGILAVRSHHDPAALPPDLS
ncbi:LysR family transcriptional regulator [Novosphingobium pokkalii]|uniref:LysR family transcriptional regulator n=1 Tax=Novosphingobium pokkalii TaxID=1770194 RepID=UPI0036428515